ncbi:unnamed protein product [Rhodiola kirilowii]
MDYLACFSRRTIFATIYLPDLHLTSVDIASLLIIGAEIIE